MSVASSFWLWKAQVDPISCQRTVRQAEKIGFRDGVIGANQNKKDLTVRNCGVAWLPRMHVVECLLTAHAHEANQSMGWWFHLHGSFECAQIARYASGPDGQQFYESHNDLFHHTDRPGMERKMSAVLFLSDPKTYAGGDLYIGREKVDCKDIGTVVVFPSFMMHRVSPVTRGVRYSATCWVSGPAFR